MPGIHNLKKLLVLAAAALCVMAIAFQASAETFFTCPETIQPGQPFVVAVTTDSINNVVVKWRGKNLAIPLNSAGQGEIILGMPLDGQEKSMPLSISFTENGRANKQSFNLKVTPKDYPTQELKVDSKFVDLSKADADRAAIERKRNDAIVARYTPERMWTLPFFRPVPGELSSTFGLRRVFNGQPRNAHRGLDFRAAAGDPIHAVADGVVALADSQFFAGNVVYVDHGLGVFSVYMHMSEIGVKEGDTITRGQVIGKVGSTGRVTGPHLHLSLMLQGTGADPLPLLETKSILCGFYYG